MLRMLTYPKHRVTSVCFSADGNKLVSGSYDKTLKVWSVGSSGTFECESTLAGHTRYVPAFPCSACSQSRVVCSLFSDAQGSLGRLLRQDREEARLMQCRQDNQDLGRDNRGAHWLAPGRAHQVRTCFAMLCLSSKSCCLLTFQQCAGRS